MTEISDALKKQIEADECMGSHDKSGSLGICRMPKGYALMLNADLSHFYWLRFDGVSSDVSWDKWSVWRGANLNAGDHTPKAEIAA